MGESERVNTGTQRGWEPDVEIQFPPLPQTVADVTNLMAENTDPPDTPRLAEIVMVDPVIGAAVLRRINSAYYGLRTRIAEIDKACQLLGFEEVCDIVLTAGMIKLGDIFDREPQMRIFDKIVELSVGSAAYNKKLAEAFGLPDLGLAFTTGLLHTVGRLVLLYNRPTEYEELWFTVESSRPPAITSEQITFGTDHAEVNAMAGQEWNLPDDTVSVIRNYLTPGHIGPGNLRILALSLAVASTATDHYCLNEGDSSGEFSPPAALYALARALEVQPARISELLEEERSAVQQFIHTMVEPHSE